MKLKNRILVGSERVGLTSSYAPAMKNPHLLPVKKQAKKCTAQVPCYSFHLPASFSPPIPPLFRRLKDKRKSATGAVRTVNGLQKIGREGKMEKYREAL